MHNGFRSRLARLLGVDDPVGRLSRRLSASDLNSLLLDVFREKANSSSPADLLRRYEANRFVQPAAVDAIRLKQLELDTLTVARGLDYEPVQLSPLTPLGSCSIVASSDQNKVVSALRGTEVTADATNSLALHIAGGLQAGMLDNREHFVRYSTTHRHVRAQRFEQAPGMLAHFSLFALAASGRDRGSYDFVYYKGFQFTVIARIGESTLPIGDGGLVDWTQQLLGSRKERMMISAIGLERLAAIEGSEPG
ncbi:hypothetical protein B1A99_02515 [Cohnella sp. CIP 111063]|uniref:hypothetical protein n=1 Tax=unclassified Cohnella TaxID=2636738 RepID=UPI000B8BEEBD|nr:MULTISPECIES: hypothetical protein [unclassified Cohnella]OXS62745.1 hypothetical protein B1A99_02515 [Cohnella sp. CIP 111063]PRX75018.1 hypothetical protein B0G52_101517 [Cohnella sp. SGD-V74]